MRFLGRVLSSVAVIGVSLPLAGCASGGLKVRVQTDPPFEQAQVSVSGYAVGQSLVDQKTLDGVPAVVSLSDDADSFTFAATGPGLQPGSFSITRVEIESSPVVNGAHELKIPVKQEYKEQTRYNIVYDAGSGDLVAVGEPVRAWTKVIEDSGTSPSLVRELPDNCGIKGMALSPDGKKLVYSKATVKLTRQGAPTAEDTNNGAGRSARRFVDVEACNLEMINLADPLSGLVSGSISQITRDAFRDVYPSFADDGKSIRFTSNRMHRNKADILQLRATGQEGGIQVIYDGGGDRTALRPSTASDGTTAFALVSEGSGGLAEGNIHIWIHGPNHPYPSEVAIGTDPQISPDGRHIVYINESKNLCVISTDASPPNVLTFDASDIEHKYRASLFDEIVTVQGASLADELRRRFGEDMASRLLATYGRNLADAEPRKLMDDWLAEEFNYDPKTFLPYSTPSWSPDGSTIVFTSMKGADATGRPNQDIWMTLADGSRSWQMTNNGSVDSDPLVSSDGQNLYFLSNRGGRWGIWQMKNKPELALHP